jgi:NadR type nicotinamide-nucleotide adenylyltransferase
MEVKKIVTIGPESTGKSFLSQQLSDHYNSIHVPEYAREYLMTNGNKYTYSDLAAISDGQLREEEASIDLLQYKMRQSGNVTSPFLFIDTDMYVMKVWSEFVFNRCETSILNRIVSREYHLYLLCKPDLPWIKDELREYPELENRIRLYNHYLDAMVNQSVPWTIISGNYEERFNKAVKFIDALFQ